MRAQGQEGFLSTAAPGRTLRSRWTNPFLCMYSRPASTWAGVANNVNVRECQSAAQLPRNPAARRHRAEERAEGQGGCWGLGHTPCGRPSAPPEAKASPYKSRKGCGAGAIGGRLEEHGDRAIEML